MVGLITLWHHLHHRKDGYQPADTQDVQCFRLPGFKTAKGTHYEYPSWQIKDRRMEALNGKRENGVV